MEEIQRHSEKENKKDNTRFFSEIREIHVPNQVTEIEQLVVGKKYQRYSIQEDGTTQPQGIFEVIKLNPREKLARIKALDKSGRTLWEGNLYLSDNGIIPYDTGIWNLANYIVPVV